jgi:hypothetical protein
VQWLNPIFSATRVGGNRRRALHAGMACAADGTLRLRWKIRRRPEVDWASTVLNATRRGLRSRSRHCVLDHSPVGPPRPGLRRNSRWRVVEHGGPSPLPAAASVVSSKRNCELREADALRLRSRTRRHRPCVPRLQGGPRPDNFGYITCMWRSWWNKVNARLTADPVIECSSDRRVAGPRVPTAGHNRCQRA